MKAELKVTPEVLDKICEMRRAKIPIKEISKQFGIHHSTIERHLKRIGMTKKREKKVYEKPKHPESTEKGTLCWDCALSVLGDKSPCSWHRKEHKPRDDWEAIRRDRTYCQHTSESYIVISCPGFVKG